MSLNVALVDKSEIIKKMLSHCLHYYSPEVYRFENLDELKSQSGHIKPDIVFVDWDLKQNNEPLALSAKKTFESIPLVVIYRNGEDKAINNIPHRIKKPLDANLLRKMVSDLVPKVSKLKIHDFLTFPQKDAKLQKLEKEIGPPPDLSSPEKVSPPPGNLNLDLNLEETQTQILSTPSSPSQKSPPKDTKEITLNNFPPMAVKAGQNEITQTQPTFSGNKNSQDQIQDGLLKVLKEYRHSLEFEQVMEKSLKSYTENILAKIFEKDTDGLFKQSFSQFKNTEEFKKMLLEITQDSLKDNSQFQDLFEKEISLFIKAQLPVLAKDIIKQEIKKILEENP